MSNAASGSPCSPVRILKSRMARSFSGLVNGSSLTCHSRYDARTWRAELPVNGVDASVVSWMAAAVLPVLSDPSGPDPQVLLIRQYRYAAGGFMLEVPAGRPDRAGEDWEVCARRELEEETGYRAAEWARAGILHNAIGYSDEGIEVFRRSGVRTLAPLALDVRVRY